MRLGKKVLHFFSTVLIISKSFLCLGQSTQIHFEHITTEEGLSQNDVNCIYQDKKGFLWLGTHDGLNKYDGYDFTIYKPEPDNPSSINSNLIYAIAAEGSGKLWIGTTGKGLNLFDPETETFTHYIHNPIDSTSLASNYIFTLFEDSHNRLWVGTDQGLCVWNRMENEAPIFRRLNGQSGTNTDLLPNRVQAIFEDSRGIIWFGTNNGLYRLEDEFSFTRANDQYLAANAYINSIKQDQSGYLLIATNTGLFYQKAANTFIQLLPGTHQEIVADDNGHIWTGSRQGLSRIVFDHKEDKLRSVEYYRNEVLIPHSLNKNLIKSLLVDKTGVIWIGTNGGGINKVDPRRKQFRHFKKDLVEGSLNYNKIRSIFEDSQENLWVGTEGGGLNYQLKRDDDGNYQHFQHMPQPGNIFALHETQIKGKPQVLIGAAESSSGLYEVDLDQLSPQNILLKRSRTDSIGNSIFTILQSSSGVIWLGTYSGGLYRLIYDQSSENYQTTNFRYKTGDSTSISSNIIRSIIEDHQGNLWIGTGNGLNKLTASEQKSTHPTFIRYQNSDREGAISHDYILSLLCSEKGEIWVGTFGGGLNKYLSKSDSFHFFQEKDGLPNNVIKGILEDDHGQLWLASNKGLTKFDPQTNTIVNYDTNDGLQSNEFSELACLKRRNGEMLFGGVNGFNAFFPDSIKDNPHIPNVVLTSFHILNKPVNAGEKHNDRILLEKSISELTTLTLKHDENSFSFEFSALHFAAPQKNQYAFILEGFQDEWVYVSAERRFANYTNLTPGNYRFMVKASNNDGKWNELPTVIDIKILPPFWLTWWAYGIYAGILILLLFAFQKYTVIGIKEKHQLELEHLEKEQAEELQRLKLRFFTNISHEIRTPLTLIAGPMDQLIKKGKQLSELQIQDHYRLIKRNTDYLLRLINQLLDFRKIDQGKMKLNVQEEDLLNYVREIMEPFQFMARKKQLHYQLRSKLETFPAYFDQGILEKALYNLLSNAFKFTPNQGSIIVELILEEKYSKKHKRPHSFARIDVKDTGSGIAEAKQKIIFDRFFKESKKSYQNKEGTGIGLAFTKSLIELHKGKITVDSQEGKGTCFSIYLPIDKNAYTKSEYYEVSAKPELLNSSASLAGKSEEIKEIPQHKAMPLLLIVDDHDDIRHYIKGGLKDAYRIIESTNGRSGLETAQKQLPDLIISDVMMPEVNGIEMCKQLKTDPNTSHIPIIILTAKSSEENELLGLESGADAYVRKPFKLKLLKARIRNILVRRKKLHKRFRKEIFLDPSEVAVSSTDELFLKDAVGLIEAHMDNPDFNVEEMTKEIGMSRSKLYLKIKALTGQSSSEFIRTVRLKRAVQLFEQSDHSVKEIMHMTGFNTASYFSKCFKKEFGMTPSEFVSRKREELV